jgi:mannosyl-oligosaccharide alpha-1,2-mannosidase
MPSKDSLLPIYYRRQLPLKLCKKYLLFISIALLITLSLICVIYLPRITTSFNNQYSYEKSQTLLSVLRESQSINKSFNSNNEFSDLNNNNTVVEEVIINTERTVHSINDTIVRNWKPLVLPTGEDPNPVVAKQRNYIKEMMKHSWNNYVKYAWGQNELKPMSRSSHTSSIFGDSKLGATIVDAMDTLLIMNMTEEFQMGRNWIQKDLNIEAVDSSMSLFETVIRFVGGLLSCFALTNDQMFLLKAREISDKMLPAFNTETGLPLSVINPKTGQSANYPWASSGSSILAEVGTQHLEFVYLSDMSGDQRFKEKVVRVRKFLDSLSKPYDGLYRNYINPKTGEWGEDQVSVGALGDSFYEYLIKSWIQSNGEDLMARQMYDKSVDAIEKHLIQTSNSGLTYLAQMNFGQLEHKMQHLTCFAGGMFAIGGQSLSDSHKRNHYLQLGANITKTCYESYARTATKIGPEAFYFTEKQEAIALNDDEKYYILRPEVIESYFYLWRLTHEQKYRDYAWSAAQAIGRYCRTENGFSGIRNVTDIKSAKDDVQQSFFLAETLKYLYLIFSTDDLISFDEWVFNTEAHPLPILSKNPAYPKKHSL